MKGKKIIKEEIRIICSVCIFYRCTNPWRDVAVASVLRMALPNICGFSVWNFLHFHPVTSWILKYISDFWKICTPLL